MIRTRKLADSTYPLYFLMVDSADHITGKTGLSPTVALSKNGAAFAAPAGAVSEVGNGLYKIAGNATDTDTLGSLWIHATAIGADPTDVEYAVVPYDVFSRIDADAKYWGGVAVTGMPMTTFTYTAPDNATISNNAAGIAAIYGRIGAPAGLSVSADIAALAASAGDPWAVTQAELDAYPAGSAGDGMSRIVAVPGTGPIGLVPAPATSAKCKAYLYTESIIGVKRAGVAVTARLSVSPASAGGYLLESAQATATTNAQGYAEFLLPTTAAITPTGTSWIFDSPELGLNDAATPLPEGLFDLSQLCV